jgi:short-subunit dehydrogenase
MAILKGKTVLITGATGGLGQVVAKQCRSEGAHLLLVSRSQQKLEILNQQLTNEITSNAAMKLFALDFAHPDFEAISKNPVDVLINTAAIQGPIGAFIDNDWESFEETLKINLLSPIALIKACLPQMIKNQYGKIINISGGGATSPRARFSAYGTAKAALVRFSETLAEELKHVHVDVNCIAPGVMPTPMLRALQDAHEFSGTEPSPDAISKAAALCVYLASSESDGITGKIISAAWDPWEKLKTHKQSIMGSDIYTLRRIVPEDRGLTWAVDCE